jgi:hypothetical protein
MAKYFFNHSKNLAAIMQQYIPAVFFVRSRKSILIQKDLRMFYLRAVVRAIKNRQWLSIFFYHSKTLANVMQHFFTSSILCIKYS